ncbi:hypothetical protein ACC699_39815, partial [Rhizobium ruizarguesonis]
FGRLVKIEQRLRAFVADLLIDFAREHQIEIDYVPGQLNVAQKESYKRAYYENAEIAAFR